MAISRGAFGTIQQDDTGPRRTWRAHVSTLLAVLGPGLIVMVGDNDAGAFATYSQAGQNYGTTLLWTLLLLIPVLYVNQEMVLRLGAVSRVGHARLILERFGKFWGAFSVIDLFLLNGLTIVTEFIGISLGLDYLGIPKLWGISIAALLIIVAASTGNFRRFERFSMMLVVGSFLLIPIIIIEHPPVGQIAHDFFLPQLPKNGELSDIILLIIAIVGTTVAPWQLFFQQSYVIDKRLTSRFVNYERVDLIFGIILVVIGGVALMAFSAAAFMGTADFGKFSDVGGISAGLQKYVGHVPAVLFALALIDASIIGAAAVSLSTAYAIGDVLSLRHSLHHKPIQAKSFYAIYGCLIALSAALVLIPGSPLGLLTEAVQTLAGILLPSATVFLLLLCNDREVLGPWVNTQRLNLFTGAVIAILVMLSIILTASVLYPDMSANAILDIFAGGGLIAVVVALVAIIAKRSAQSHPMAHRAQREGWHMPPLSELKPMKLTPLNRLWMIVLRAYLIGACGLLVVRVVQIAMSGK